MYYAADIVRELKASEQIVVFGAGIIAYNAVNCLIRSPYLMKVDYCVVSDLNMNPEKVMGISVISLETAEKVVRKDAVVLIAALDKNLDSIKELLHHQGFFHTVPITFHSDLWERLRGNYFKEYCLLHHKPYLTLEEELQRMPKSTRGAGENHLVHIYTVRNHADKKIQEDLQRFAWEIPIQAGAGLTIDRVCKICDNVGENISHKNKEYCELTALYWIWKHERAKYVGLCHYRRHFELDVGMIERLVCSDIDVVLTIPILNFPSVRDVYQHDHIGKDWETMLDAICVLFPDYLADAMKVQEGNFYYGYNMFIVKNRILDDYCTWLFSLLEYCENRCGKKEDPYQNRYIGFLAERLLTIYMIHHEDRLKIVHAKKHFVDK